MRPGIFGAILGGAAAPLACLALATNPVLAEEAPPPTEHLNIEITSGPHGLTNKHFATFRFTANDGATDFRCQLDSGRYRPCSSPVTFRHLASGVHSFQVETSIRYFGGGQGVATFTRWMIS